jgi:hypothetical protein
MRNWSPSRSETLALAGLLLLALALRLPLLGWGLPDVLEEAIPFRIAWGMWGWNTDWRLGFDPGFFRYPSLVIYLQLAAQVLHYVALRLAGSVHSLQEFYAIFQVAPSSSLVIARSITTAFGVLTLWPAWCLARRAGGLRAAIVAVVLLAFHPVLLARAQLVEVDLPLTFFTTWGLLLAVRFAEHPTARRAVGMGLVFGLATSCKYTGAMLLAAALVAIVIAHRAPAERPAPVRARAGRTGRRSPPARADAPRGSAPGAAPRLGWALLCGVALLAAFVATSPYVLVHRDAFMRDLLDERQHMALGHFGLAGGPALLGYAREWFTTLMGWPLGIAALVGLAWFAARRRAWALVLVGFFLPYALIVGSWQTQAERYLVPLVPVGVVAAAALAIAVLDAVAARLARRSAGAQPPKPAVAPGRIAAGVGLVLAILVLGGALALGLPAVYASRRTDTRSLAREWIEARIPPGSLILTEAYGPELFTAARYRQLKWSPRAVRDVLRSRHYEPPLYAVLDLPLFQVAPERSARFYSMRACSLADVVIVSSSVRDRYRSAPARFGPQLAFYDSLETGWRKLQVLRPGRGPGPELVIYGNPRATVPFAERHDLGPAGPLAEAGALTGAEGAYYTQLGLDYEIFGHRGQAKQCYLWALEYGRGDPTNYVLAATWLSMLLWREQGPRAASRVLAAAERNAGDPRTVEQLAALRASFESGASAPPGQ